MNRVMTPFRLNPGTKHKAKQLAEINGRSLSNFVEFLLNEAIREAEADGTELEEYEIPGTKKKKKTVEKPNEK